MKDNRMENGNTMLKIRFQTRVRIFVGIGCTALAAVLFSCQKGEQKRTFSEVQGFDTPVQDKEIVIPANHGTVAEEAHGPGDGHGHAAPGGKLGWVLPKGWEAHVGTGMYYAIVKTSNKADAGEIGILSLPGEAGGLTANAERWLGQIGVQLPPAGMENFLSSRKSIKSKGALDVTVLDYTTLVKEDEGTSMLVAIAKPAEDSYFIKWTGKKGDLAKERKSFLAFVSSLSFE